MNDKKDALRERLRKDVEASARRPRHERRHMPAIAESMACDNCGTSARVYNPECCHVQGCHLCVIPPGSTEGEPGPSDTRWGHNGSCVKCLGACIVTDSAEKDAHRILHRFGGEEVVCTCGAYFRTDYTSLGTQWPRTATAKWAEHYRDIPPDSCSRCGHSSAYCEASPRGCCRECRKREHARVTSPERGQS